MKRRPVLILMLITLLVLGLTAGYIYYQKTVASPQAPEISFDNDTISVTTDSTDADLLEGVTALDPEDGDVTASVLVESVSSIVNGNQATITYVAFDSKNHLTRATRTAVYTDYKSPVFDMSHSMLFRASGTLNILNYVTAADMFDGDITNKIIYSFVGASNNLNMEGEHEIELRVTNSMGDTSKLTLKVEICSKDPNAANIQLNKYLVYIPVGAGFDPADYFKSYMSGSETVSSMDGITVNSDVDTSKAGVYVVTYASGSGDSLSRAKLIVVVE